MTQECKADYSKWIEYLDQLGYRKVVLCKDCKYQEVSTFFGRKLYGCELAEGYSHVCLDDDFCSRAERKTDNG